MSTVPESEASSTAVDTSLTATCHCGRVQVKMPSKPSKLNECHCSVCYKYGALWGYFEHADVEVTTSLDNKLQSYIREDTGSEGDISFECCSHCGCMVLWWGERGFAGPEHKMGVNCRLLPLEELEGIESKISLKT